MVALEGINQPKVAEVRLRPRKSQAEGRRALRARITNAKIPPPSMYGAALATRRLPPVLPPLSRGLAIESWFEEAHDAHTKLQGSAFIPRQSAISLSDGESELPLGRVAARYRSEYTSLKLPRPDFEKLESIKFVWCKTEWKYEHVFVPTLLKYKELNGDMNVPKRFVVPSTDDWPEEMWGERLGQMASLTRSAGQYVRGDEERRQWLEQEGFVFDMLQQQWESVQRALLHFKKLEGDMIVPGDYYVPSRDDWPEEMWGMKLGNTVSMIRSSGQYVRDDEERRQWLEEQGFRIEVVPDERPHTDLKWTDVVVPTLMKYKELHGDMNAAQRFIVPSTDDWPEDMWGTKLGMMVSMIRSAGQYVRDDADRRQWLEAQGFEFNVRKLSWEKARLALLQYKELHGNMNVLARFVVPSSDDWPEEMWGMQLGNTVASIRSAGIFVRDNADRRQWLEEQGFVWKLQRSHAEKVRDAAKHYGRIRRGAAAVR